MGGFIFLFLIVLFVVYLVKGQSWIDYLLYGKKNTPPRLILKDVKIPPPPVAVSKVPEQVFYPLHYVPKRIMTRTEEYFFRQLAFIPEEGYYIFPQVHLSSLMQPDYHPYSFEWKRENSRINRKSLDFVIFRKVDMKPLLAIELDDYTHRWYKRMKRDNFVDDCMKSVGIPILHVDHATVNGEDIKIISGYCN